MSIVIVYQTPVPRGANSKPIVEPFRLICTHSSSIEITFSKNIYLYFMIPVILFTIHTPIWLKSYMNVTGIHTKKWISTYYQRIPQIYGYPNIKLGRPNFNLIYYYSKRHGYSFSLNKLHNRREHQSGKSMENCAGIRAFSLTLKSSFRLMPNQKF